MSTIGFKKEPLTSTPPLPTEMRSARYVMAGAAMISFSGIYVKWAQVGPTVSGFYRVLIGGIVLAVMALYRREQWRRELWWRDPSYFGLQVFCGLIFALDLFFWHRSVILIGPGLATILGNFQVFILALIGVALFGEHLTLKLVAAIPAAILGLFLVVGVQWRHSASGFQAGIVLGLLTALCYSGYTLSLRRLQHPHRMVPPLPNLAVVSLVTAIALGLLALAQGESFSISDIRTAGALGAYGIFSQVCGWVLISKGLPGVRASLAGLLLLLQPSLAYLWDMLFFGMEMSWIKGVGTVITLVAIYLGSSRRR